MAEKVLDGKVALITGAGRGIAFDVETWRRDLGVRRRADR